MLKSTINLAHILSKKASYQNDLLSTSIKEMKMIKLRLKEV